MKIKLKVVCQIFVSIALVITYINVFGLTSLRRYQEGQLGAVIVTEHEEQFDYIPQPGMSVKPWKIRIHILFQLLQYFHEILTIIMAGLSRMIAVEDQGNSSLIALKNVHIQKKTFLFLIQTVKPLILAATIIINGPESFIL